MVPDTNLSNRNEPVLLSVQFEDDGVKLRIDRNGLARPEFTEPPIVELTCTGAKPSAELINRLSQGVDKSFYYKIGKQEGAYNLLFTIDNSSDEPVLECKDVQEQFSDYTQADFRQKCRRLASLYLAMDEELFIVERAYGAVLANLYSALRKEMDVSARKASFFAQSKPEKTVEVIGYLQAYQKAIYLLNWEMDVLSKARRQ